MSTCRLLIVDDDIDDIVLYNESFKAQGYEIDFKFFSNPEGVFPYLTEAGDSELPHLIISDLNMPKVDGLSLLKQLKSAPRLKDIPVVICSSSANAMYIQQCLQLGAKEYLVKPNRLNAYADIVDGLVQRFFHNKCEV